MLKWSRVRLYLSVLTCAGLIATLRERVQYAPGEAAGRKKNSAASDAGRQGEAAKLYDYAGALHVHTTYSDGVGTVPQVAEAAAAAGVDFVLFCDHSCLDAMRDGLAGWHGRVLALIGTEIQTFTGHLLALDVPPSFVPASSDAVEAQSAIIESGGFGFIALPCDLKDHWLDFSRRLPEIGLEVFNLSSIARTKINLPGLALVWRRYTGSKPQKAFSLVSARPGRELRLWDQLTAASNPDGRLHPVVGIASLDAHGVMKLGRKSYTIPTYEQVFRTLRTHVVTSAPLSYDTDPDRTTADMATIHRALAQGHCYMSYDNYADASQFLFHATSKSAGQEACALMGDEITLSQNGGPVRLHAKTPRKRAFVRLYRNGAVIASSRGGQLDYMTDQPGAYRIEAHVYRYRIGSWCFGAKPWIFSNPIYVQPLHTV